MVSQTHDRGGARIALATRRGANREASHERGRVLPVMPPRARWRSAVAVFWLAIVPLYATSAQDLRSPLFQAADSALAAAEEVNASVMAPAAWEAGMDTYAAAEVELGRGGSISRIQSRLAAAEASFIEAAAAAARAATTLAPLLQTRQETLNARADVFAVQPWNDAEASLKAVSRRLESTPDATMNDRIAATETLYRDAELAAIKAQNLSQSRSLLAQATLDRVPRYAPQTYARAESLLAQAEALIEENRYELEPARRLAERAAYEARRATSMTERILQLLEEERTVEEFILVYEQGLAEIAIAAGREPRLDAGIEQLITDLVTDIEALRDRERQLQIEIEESRIRIAGLEEEIRELDEQLGGVFRERVALVQRLEAEERVREQFLRIENMFPGGQAQVSREGDSVVVTLNGLTFASGSAQIDPGHAVLLQTVGEAVDVFPQSRIVVEGHTDAYGGARSNMSLSRARAEAVGTYLSNELGVDGDRISALGYGETRPVANNETTQGRARNRRIEVRITPQPMN